MAQQNGSYEDFVRGLQPITIALRTCEAKIDREAYLRLLQGESAGSQKGARNLKSDYSVEAFSAKYFDASAAIQVTVGPEGAAPAVSVRCVFDFHFHASDAGRREFVERFTNTEFRLVAWPYFREFVSGVTSRACIPPVLVPMTLRNIIPPGTKRELARAKRARAKKPKE